MHKSIDALKLFLDISVETSYNKEHINFLTTKIMKVG